MKHPLFAKKQARRRPETRCVLERRRESARSSASRRCHGLESQERSDPIGDLTVPIARTFPLSQAPAALTALRGPHPAGKFALIAGE